MDRGYDKTGSSALSSAYGALEEDLVTRIAVNLADVSRDFGVAVVQSACGRNTVDAYFTNLRNVLERIGWTVARSDLALYRGSVYFFTGKIYERVPAKEHLERAVRLFMEKMGMPSAFEIREFRNVMKRVNETLVVSRRLEPRYNVMAFRNGVVDMRDGVLRPFGREWHVVEMRPYRYDPSARCPKWHSFLKGSVTMSGVLPDKRDRAILQMFMGLSLMDRGSTERKVESALVLFGNGSNGKSVIMNTVAGVLGRDSVSRLDMSALLRTGDERQRNMTLIDGKRLNWSSEMDARSFRGREDAAKSLISGEPQVGRRIGGDSFTIFNVPYFVFNANRFPSADDSSYGFLRRFIFLVFDRVVSSKDMNLSLTSELEDEYPGILNWMRRGALMLRRSGFRFPESNGSVRRKVIEMGATALAKSWATVRGFSPYPREGVRNDQRREIDFSLIYADMERYAELNGFPMKPKQTVAAQLRDFGFGRDCKRRTGGVIYYRGYGLKAEDLREGEPPCVADMDFIEETDFVMEDEED